VVPAALAVQPNPGVSVDRLVQDINTKVPTLDALPKNAAAESAPGRGPIQTAFLFVMGLCYLVVSVVIGFFFLTMTLRKEQSIIMLRAVGATGGYLIRCLLLEVVVVTLGGLVVGVAMLYAVKPMVRTNVIITMDPVGIASTVAPALAVALLGSLPPIRRVLRADPMAAVTRPNLSAVS
jgi:putative ABC transport system permease protein